MSEKCGSSFNNMTWWERIPKRSGAFWWDLWSWLEGIPWMVAMQSGHGGESLERQVTQNDQLHQYCRKIPKSHGLVTYCGTPITSRKNDSESLSLVQFKPRCLHLWILPCIFLLCSRQIPILSKQFEDVPSSGEVATGAMTEVLFQLLTFRMQVHLAGISFKL